MSNVRFPLMFLIKIDFLFRPQSLSGYYSVANAGASGDDSENFSNVDDGFWGISSLTLSK